MNRAISAAAAAAVCMLLVSCATLQDQGVKGTPDEKAIAKGVAAWNDKAPAAAMPYWNTVKDGALREKYTGYVDGFDSGEKSLADAAAAKRGDEARILASYEKGRKVLAGIPKELALPDDTRASGNALAEGRMRSLIAAGKLSHARELGRGAVETFGGSDEITSIPNPLALGTISRGILPKPIRPSVCPRRRNTGRPTLKSHAPRRTLRS